MGKKRNKLKKISKKKKEDKSTRVAWYFLLVVLGLLLISQIIQNMAFSVWENKSQISLIVEDNNKVYFVKIDKKFEEVLVYEFNDNMIIDVVDGYGEYEINNVKKLARQEKKNYGELLADSMTFYFGIMTDGYITTNSKKEFKIEKGISRALWGGARTNLSKWDQMKMMIFVSNLRSEDISYMKFAETGLYIDETRVDGKEVMILDENRFDNWVLSRFADSSFLEESYGVEIFNTTNYPGLASIFGRVMSNSGFDVMGVRQSKKEFDKSFLLVRDDLADNKSLKSLAKHFKLKIIKESEYESNEESFLDRVEVGVVLGTDFVERYF